jgi:phosphoribosyl-ATP pyrophosphohydrolase/phosphoribosyl-AMP cyclohydrolase/histidinol dehydrogenase
MSLDQINQIQIELVKQSLVLPRCSIVKVSLSKSFILQVDSMEQAMQFSNEYAPEHLILNVADAELFIDKVVNAGSVFVGQFSPERLFNFNISCGDYASGTNHTLPTYGYSRMYSGVNTLTFVKHITSQFLTKNGLNNIGDAVATLAEVEGLQAHRNAVLIRLKDIRKL